MVGEVVSGIKVKKMHFQDFGIRHCRDDYGKGIL